MQTVWFIRNPMEKIVHNGLKFQKCAINYDIFYITNSASVFSRPNCETQRLVKPLYIFYIALFCLFFSSTLNTEYPAECSWKLGDAEAMFFHNLCGHVTDNLELTKTTTTAMSVE